MQSPQVCLAALLFAALHARVALGTSSTLNLTHRQGRQVTAGRITLKHEFFGPIAVGDPPQIFSVVYDTGSGNLFFPSSDCTTRACTMHKSFDTSRSPTGAKTSCFPENPSDTGGLSITFGTGSITGTCHRDKVCIGPAFCNDLSFVLASQITDEPFTSFGFDGVLGLSPIAMAQGPGFSMTTVIQRSSLAKRMVSVFFTHDDFETPEVRFGDVNWLRVRPGSEFVHVKARVDRGYWEVPVGDVYLGDMALNLCSVGGPCSAAVDTGTAMLSWPSEIHKIVSEKVVSMSGSGFGACHLDRFPTLGFQVNDQILYLDPTDYIDPVTCKLSFMALDMPPPQGPLMILGIPFHVKFYTVYDTSTMSVGFAVAQHAIGTPTLIGRVAQRSNSSFLKRH